MYNDASTITLTNCTFDSNNWHSGAYGGALYNTYGTISTISGCTFTNNQNQGTFGGAIHDFESTSTIDNSLSQAIAPLVVAVLLPITVPDLH